jgi:hypothetical protein
MQFNNHRAHQFPLGSGLATILACLTLASCASAPWTPKMDSGSTARRLGLPDCNVSVPLSQSEIISFVKKWDNHPNPEAEPEWIAIVQNEQPGDQLRMVSCTVGDPYFYALIRNGAVLLKFHPSIVD